MWETFASMQKEVDKASTIIYPIYNVQWQVEYILMETTNKHKQCYDKDYIPPNFLVRDKVWLLIHKETFLVNA